MDILDRVPINNKYVKLLATASRWRENQFYGNSQSFSIKFDLKIETFMCKCLFTK